MCPTSFLAQGAIIQTFTIAGHNIVLSFPAPDLYKTHSPYFGETIGRVLNRISNARINSLNGRSYTLTANNGPNCLHGGSEGWGKKMFDGPRTASRNGKAATMFKYLSKDGEEGFPGAVECRVWYATSEEKGTVILDVEYEVEMVGKESEEEGIYETVVAVTNHRLVIIHMWHWRLLSTRITIPWWDVGRHDKLMKMSHQATLTSTVGIPSRARRSSSPRLYTCQSTRRKFQQARSPLFQEYLRTSPSHSALKIPQ